MRWLDGITDSGREYEQTPGVVKDREAWPAAVHGVAESHLTWQLNNNSKG